MGNSNFQNQTRQMGGNLSFAQSLSGSQPAAPLDMSYVLSLYCIEPVAGVPRYHPLCSLTTSSHAFSHARPTVVLERSTSQPAS